MLIHSRGKVNDFLKSKYHKVSAWRNVNFSVYLFWFIHFIYSKKKIWIQADTFPAGFFSVAFIDF